MQLNVSSTSVSVLRAGCAVLFGLPFALIGLMVGAGVLWQLSQGAWKDALVGSFYALTLGGFGFWIIIGTIRDALKEAAPAAPQASAPEEPWRWRADWAAGRIVSADRQEYRSAWLFALVSNLACSYLYFVLPGELRSGNWKMLVGLVFPLVGIYLLILAVKATLRWRRFGASTLEMEATPATVGGRLTGRITSDRLPVGATSIKLRLACVRLEKHHRSTTERVIWEAEKTLTDHPIQFSGGIPVEFDIPADCEPTSPRSCIKWTLQAMAEVPGVDYAPKFDVPVFRTSAPAVAPAEAPELERG